MYFQHVLVRSTKIRCTFTLSLNDPYIKQIARLEYFLVLKPRLNSKETINPRARCCQNLVLDVLNCTVERFCCSLACSKLLPSRGPFDEKNSGPLGMRCL